MVPASGRRNGGTAVTDFDLLGPLPQGTTVLEASAGTGKTYAIVGLATRYVAEGIAEISELLLVTFSRAATQELRERTRNRFAEVAAELGEPSPQTSTDALVRHLAREDAPARRLRLMRALSEFDSGTIATTHSFCQRMLDGLGIAGEREPETTLVEAVDDLTGEVVVDIYLRRYSRSEFQPPISPNDARQVAREAVRDRQAHLVPEPTDDSEAGHRVIFAEEVRAEVGRRKRSAGVRDFDDLLSLLHGVLVDPIHGESACARVRDRFRVVLVDEFQDTDPLQWDILRRAFHGTSTLLLVGDPKQAIYAFRGAEVLSYLDAVALADRHLELTTNWRSDAGLLAALETVYAGAALGHDDIVVHPVASTHAHSRIPDAPPLRVRYLPRTGAGPLNKSGFPAVGALRSRVANDLAADIVGMLESPTKLALPGHGDVVTPGDVAVLVRTRSQISLVREALDQAGVPSVLAGGSSVFETPSATQWLWLLQAIEQPHRADRVRLAALTPLLGWTADTLDARGDDAVAEVSSTLRDYGVLFGQAGFAAVFEKLSAETSLEARLLGIRSGERQLTDLRHVAQLLNRAAVEESFGPSALMRWLTDRIEDPASGSVSDRSRRLDSDAAAVQLATVHASKGLEFPVVYVPYAWDASKNPYPSTLLLHDENGQRVLDVGGSSGLGYAQRKLLRDKEEAGEELRLLYVALTRAQCQVVLWWAPSYGTSSSPLHRLLFGRVPGILAPEDKIKVPDDAGAARRLESWAGSSAGKISIESAGGAAPRPIRNVSDRHEIELDAATFGRSLDHVWRRTSYSALTAGAHESPGVSSEPEQPDKDDEPAFEPPAFESPVDETLEGIASPMNGLPAGAAFGTLVHEILEHLDTGAEDLEAEVLRRCVDAVGERLADIEPSDLASALLPVLRTPLGFGTLADIAPADHLAELDFELPLAGGDAPVSQTVTLRAIAALMRKYLPLGDVLASYADQLEMLESTPLRGYLTGSIDSVLRIPGPRYVIVDYKTNRLSTGDLTVMNFTRDRMAQEMLRSHYPLQALLYAVALHRYLRWRQPGYDPGTHLGGVQYHFVRGMVGPETPEGCGVFEWNPPVELVTSVSDLLAGIETS
ncbi:UvrD-helicase domain-containing protein [Rhodococcus sp. G-MC3]|uniref:UvrD-helicase domain-containing protein n=1 Tax=Rhodococcus sp. G-MC3 TaxID=3046209 RepID=UPI0024BB39CE|nr:UvrD-helicase domain-containing protein [Rhodococcus sp. G-MC3]MDJ0396086.1 UvrD-helicase domain-containing protein [Rhodococcus sp. G-MC3]